MTYVRHFCDFCRKEISYGDLGEISIPIPPFRGRPSLDPSPEKTSYAICPSCARELKERCEQNRNIISVDISKTETTTKNEG